jgi:hypothetical protein
VPRTRPRKERAKRIVDDTLDFMELGETVDEETLERRLRGEADTVEEQNEEEKER